MADCSEVLWIRRNDVYAQLRFHSRHVWQWCVHPYITFLSLFLWVLSSFFLLKYLREISLRHFGNNNSSISSSSISGISSSSCNNGSRSSKASSNFSRRIVVITKTIIISDNDNINCNKNKWIEYWILCQNYVHEWWTLVHVTDLFLFHFPFYIAQGISSQQS